MMLLELTRDSKNIIPGGGSQPAGGAPGGGGGGGGGARLGAGSQPAQDRRRF